MILPQLHRFRSKNLNLIIEILLRIMIKPYIERLLIRILD